MTDGQKVPEEARARRKYGLRRILSILGPGLITGAADDDPSGIATYSIAGAQFGTQLLWTAWFTWPLMSFVQMMCARIGMVTGMGLARSTSAEVSEAGSDRGLLCSTRGQQYQCRR